MDDIREKRLFAQSFGHGHGASHRRADHRVVAHADEAHHFDVRRHRRGACELRVAVHTAHGVGQAVGSRASRHVVRVQGAAGAAAGRHGEVFFAVFERPFL